MSITRDQLINRVALHLEVISGTEDVPADMSDDISKTIDSCLAFLARIENFHEPDPATEFRDEAVIGLVHYIASKCYSILQSPRDWQTVSLEAKEGLIDLRRLTEPSGIEQDPNSVSFF